MTQAPDASGRRRRLLFIAPTMPAQGGNGLAMRAAALLDGYSRRFEITLYVVPVAGGPAEPTAFALQRTARIGVLNRAAGLEPQAALIERVLDPAERHRHLLAYPRPWMARLSGAAASRQLDAWLGGEAFDALHVMRLYLAPLALPFQGKVGLALLDLDEDDARLQDDLACLHARHGDARSAALARAEAARYRSLAQTTLGAASRAPFRVVLTSAAVDAERLGTLHAGARFVVVPNTYPAVRPDAAHDGVPGRLRLLFVGNFGYLPNVDAAVHLVHEILPALRLLHPDVEIDLVGSGGTDAMLGSIERPAGVRVHGAVADLAALYSRADVAVVPLRAGGGTRIKILEAFAHALPVVATPVGAAGLEAVHGRHLLLADGPVDFAMACFRLHRCARLRRRLVGAATELLQSRYSPACVSRALDAVIGASGRGT